MGRNGAVYFYTKTEVARPKAVIQKLLELNGAAKVSFVVRSKQENDEWNRFQRGEEQADDELLGKNIATEEAIACYRPGRCLSLDVGKSHWGEQFGDEFEQKIPKDVRGDFLPGQLVISAGFHDLFECAEHEEGLFFARAFLSVSFFGYGSPDLWPETREAIHSLPATAKILKVLQEVCGAQFDVVAIWYL